MFATLVTILWIIFIVNGFALIGSLSLGKFLFNSNIMFMRILMDPAGTSESVNKAAAKTIRFAGWTAISGALLFLIYF